MTTYSKAVTVHSRLFVLDLDRCLITDRAYTLLDEVVAESGIINLDLFQEARRKREASGGSFDSIAWLQSQESFGEQEYNLLLTQYVARARQMGDDILLAPGARALLDGLRQHTVPHIIMTYGGRASQLAKIQAAGLERIAYIVVDHKNKAAYIAEWWDEVKGLYTVNLDNDSLQAEAVVLVDDKAAAFTDLPSAPLASGYWVKSSGLLLPSQEGEIPSNVRSVANLHEIVDLERLY
ncbi:MAG: hypothetical protein JWO61_35 [Candidatus Saccharibacteria bacterium]|nr:hypothetical protein [Candidatus Saccharibacteria bacterium]